MIDWEVDDRRLQIAEKTLITGESLVWIESDPRFEGYARVKKTLRRSEGSITFLVQEENSDLVLTVGTMGILDDEELL